MRLGKIFIGIGISLFVIFLAAGFLIYRLLYKSLPDYSATFDLQGISAPVKIYYDEFAVAHIDAASEGDLFFAQGFAHARERLWQMEFQRRAGSGRLSEVLGAPTIGFDKLFRTIGIRRLADSLWQSGISTETRQALEAYTDGVNEYLRLVKDGDAALPTEFDVLGYEPETWTPQDCLTTIRLLGWELNIAWQTDVVLAELTERLGKEKAMQIYPDYPKGKPLIIPSTDSLTEKSKKPTKKVVETLKHFRAEDFAFREVFGTAASHLGSNSWAVTKSKSATGKAMLANDPHLGFISPARWYEVQLTCESAGINAAGCSLPGVPSIVLGKNDSIAWGLTNVMADDCDFFRIPKDSLAKMSVREIDEEIKVKGAEVVRVTVRQTPYGVIIDDETRYGSVGVKSPLLQKEVIAMRWTGAEKSDEARAFLGLLKAKNWNEFRESLRYYAVPGQNFLYADAQGNIGYQAAVRLPVRPDKQGFLLREAGNAAEDWKGSVPFDSLPTLFNPPSNQLVSANNKPVGDDYFYYISALWEAPSRAERITELLAAKEKFSAADFEAIQSDVISPHARDNLFYLLNALNGDTLSAHQKPIAYLKNWQYDFEKSSIAATIYTEWFARLIHNTLHDELGDDSFQSYVSLINMPTRVLSKLLTDSTIKTIVADTTAPDSLKQFITQTTYNEWFDDIATPQPETRDDIIRKSFSESIAALQTALGSDEAKWRWDAVHSLTIRHLFGQRGRDGSETPLARIFNLGAYPTSGTATTINNGEFSFRGKGEGGLSSTAQKLGASSRRVVDFSTPHSFRSVVPGGQSGEAMSAHYADQIPLWLNGSLKDFFTDRTEFEKRNYKLTQLRPK